MGMYVCVPHQERYNLKKGMGATNHAICEICGHVDGDWKTKFDVIFTHDINRPIAVEDPRQFAIDQLAARKTEQ